jgi:hypothetical protein
MFWQRTRYAAKEPDMYSANVLPSVNPIEATSNEEGTE